MFLVNIVRIVVAAVIIVAVAELSKRSPRYGALLLSLPLMSILALMFSWKQFHDLPAISKLSRESVVFVLLGLPFFIPFAFSSQLGLGFWSCMALGIVLASICLGIWIYAT
ncbi:MAG: hypothetical protein JNL18_18185 [Planctomycetaceae bacterium]|nr:hypothetical protein [Planctomycetaceae bacterium]